jgi:hypothetical protein
VIREWSHKKRNLRYEEVSGIKRWSICAYGKQSQI